MTSAPISSSRTGRQIVLPWSKTIEIAWKNIRLRLGRSLLVTSGIVLAIAFLTSIQTHEAILTGLRTWIATAPASERAEALRLEGELQSRGIATTPEKIAAKRLQSRWLIGLALLVAFVGVLNAMLMSVTERFREIGTMKCLGALNGFIVKLFLIESLFQGVVGAVIGALLGVAVSVLSASVSYGRIASSHLPWIHLAADVSSAILIGIGLTVLGAIYPAWRAAKMLPIEAMRAEV
ncbi:MAG: ABC transporter permease [Anaerolineae bacterium]|nr:ABC transporter permease [Phycisphaerae bacterium]